MKNANSTKRNTSRRVAAGKRRGLKYRRLYFEPLESRRLLAVSVGGSVTVSGVPLAGATMKPAPGSKLQSGEPSAFKRRMVQIELLPVEKEPATSTRPSGALLMTSADCSIPTATVEFETLKPASSDPSGLSRHSGPALSKP